LPNNFDQGVSLKQQGSSRGTFKKVSFALVCLATLLLVLDIIDIKMAFGRNEVGLWDNMPSFAIKCMFLAYPILLLASYILFVWTRKFKTRFDTIGNILFLLNGLTVVLLFVIYLIELAKNL
jgi:hypothetical protein